MKKAILITALAISNLSFVIAQAPQSIPYQAVARDVNGNLIANQNVSLRFTIHDATATGSVVYSETQSATTNALGLFTVNIGQGLASGAPFSTINWGTNAKFTQVEIDITGGASYVDMGTQQLMSVPYALYAATSGSSGGGSGTVSGSLNYVGRFTPTGTSIGNSQIYDDGTNVGIGTTAPSIKLEVISNSTYTAIKGQSNISDGVGVSAACNTGTDAVGIYGESTTGYAGYFSGKVRVNNKLGINTLPTYPLSFEDAVGDKISFYGASGAHYGIGIQGGLLQIHSNILGSDIAFGYGQSSAMTTNVTMKGDGKVGVGTTTPAAMLHVVRGTNANAPNGTAEFDGSLNSSHFNYNNTEDTYIRGGAVGSKVYINDVAGTGDVLMAANNGNVGIGTYAPANKLEVAGNADFTGNVGIGVANPAARLDVLGDVNFTGNVHSSGPTAGFRFDDRTGGAASAWQWYANSTSANLFQHATGADRLTIAGDGNVGLGNNNPLSPLSFPATLGKKISLYPGATGDAGFGVFANELRINSDYSGADITLGYDGITSGFTERMRVTGSGKVGINSYPVDHTLTVKTLGSDSQVLQLETATSLANFVENTMSFKTGNSYTGQIKTIGSTPFFFLGARMGFFTLASTSTSGLLERMSILNNGDVLIGTTNELAGLGYKLRVNGKIICTELRVQVNGLWPDYVFNTDYHLMPLNNLKEYISKEKHLPNIPSSKEVNAQGGIDAGDMQKRLTEKVEELTLYILDLQNQVDELKKQR